MTTLAQPAGLGLTDERERTRQANARLGTVFFLAAEGMFFLGIVSFALYIRRQFATWPPPGTPTPNGTVLVANALVLLASAVLALVALRWVEVGWRWQGRAALGAALLAGALFLAGQLAEFTRLGGWSPRGDMFRTLFDTLAALHGAHVASGLLGLALALGVLWLARREPGRRGQVLLTAVTWYWVFIALTWPVLLVVLTVPA